MSHRPSRLKTLFSLISYEISEERCLLCGIKLKGPSLIPGNVLCENCRARLIFFRPPRCRRCGEELISRIDLCKNCRERDFSFDSGFSLHPYKGAAKELLYLYKKENYRSLALFFAWELHYYFLSQVPKIPIVPVPFLKKNLKQRGWDPLGTIADKLAQKYAYRILPALKRLPSRSQKDLNLEEREENIKNKISVRQHFLLPEQVYLLDDVWTSGSTVNECAKVLKKNGVREVHVLTLIRD